MDGTIRLIDGYGHLADRVFCFLREYCEGIVPAGRLDEKIYWYTKKTYDLLSERLETGERRKAEELVEEYLKAAVEYLESGAPWEAREDDWRRYRSTILNSVQMLANLTVYLEMLLPDPVWKKCPGIRVKRWLALGEQCLVWRVHSGYELPPLET